LQNFARKTTKHDVFNHDEAKYGFFVCIQGLNTAQILSIQDINVVFVAIHKNETVLMQHREGILVGNFEFVHAGNIISPYSSILNVISYL
jgi:hypothetical protein